MLVEARIHTLICQDRLGTNAREQASNDEKLIILTIACLLFPCRVLSLSLSLCISGLHRPALRQPEAAPRTLAAAAGVEGGAAHEVKI